MFAIIKTGGKQVKVELGTEIFIEKIAGNDSDKVIFDEVLMADGIVGNPFIKGGQVTGTIIKQGKGKKIRVVRYHPKKNIRKVYGHRQPYTKVRIDEILVGSAKPKAEKKVEVAKTETVKKTATTKSTAKPKTTTTKKVEKAAESKPAKASTTKTSDAKTVKAAAKPKTTTTKKVASTTKEK